MARNGDGEPELRNEPEGIDALSKKRKFHSEEPQTDENPCKAACRSSDTAPSTNGESPDDESTHVDEKPWSAVINRLRARGLGQGRPEVKGPEAQALHRELRAIFEAYNALHHAMEGGKADNATTADHFKVRTYSLTK